VCLIHLGLGPDLPVQQNVREQPYVLHHGGGLCVQAELPVFPQREDGPAAAAVQQGLRGHTSFSHEGTRGRHVGDTVACVTPEPVALEHVIVQ